MLSSLTHILASEEHRFLELISLFPNSRPDLIDQGLNLSSFHHHFLGTECIFHPLRLLISNQQGGFLESNGFPVCLILTLRNKFYIVELIYFLDTRFMK